MTFKTTVSAALLLLSCACGASSAPPDPADAAEDCTPEGEAEFCLRHQATCGRLSKADNCGASRTAECGACASPRICGGGGVPNACARPGAEPDAGGAGADPDAGVAGADATIAPTDHWILFDELPASTKVEAQYLPYAKFSAGAGFAVYTYTPPSSVPLVSLPLLGVLQRDGDPGSYALEEGFTLEFPQPVNQLRFNVFAVNSSGQFAQVDVVGATSGTVNLMGVGDPTGRVAVDLSQFTEISRIVVRNVADLYGVGYDDFHFVR
ncbi:MAG TPA: hypothetical protein VGK67_28140 [Myxococcales bacterium]|jgi:hypothetical protein